MYKKYVEDIVKIYNMEEDEYDLLDKKNLDDEKYEIEEEKIYNKYNELLTKNNKKYNVIFRYDLHDAWGMQLSTLVITSDKKDNVWCVYDTEDEKEFENKYFAIDSKKIENILEKYIDKIDLDKLSDSEEKILDGVSSEFYIDVNDKTLAFKIDNIAYWGEEIGDANKAILDMFSDIYNELDEIVDNIENCMKLE